MKIPNYEKAIRIPHMDTHTKPVFMFEVKRKELSLYEINLIVRLVTKDFVVSFNRPISQKSVELIEKKIILRNRAKALKKANKEKPVIAPRFWCSN